MAYLTSALDTIRGYKIMINSAGEEYKFYDENAYEYNNVRDAIVTVLQTLMFNKYPDVDISTEIQTIQTAKLGTTIREAIYSAVKKLLNSIGIVAMVQISQVRYAHYGSDMREPLYDILIKLGADSDDITPYRPTTVDDYIYNIEDNNATLLYYIGNPNEYISIPSMINVEGANYSVKYLGEMLFNENSILKAIEIPESVEVIS